MEWASRADSLLCAGHWGMWAQKAGALKPPWQPCTCWLWDFQTSPNLSFHISVPPDLELRMEVR